MTDGSDKFFPLLSKTDKRNFVIFVKFPLEMRSVLWYNE